MSEKKDDKIIGLKLTFEECEHGNEHLTNVAPLRESDVVYDANKNSTTVGWSPLYASKWEDNFGKKAEVTDEDLN